MTALRQRMIEDMQVRNLPPHTQATYILHVSLFARHFCKSPELLGPEEIRDYQLYLTNQRRLAPSSIVITTAALRFLYNVILRKGWNLEASIPAPKQPKKLPVVLSRAEVAHFLSCIEDIKHRAILTTCYAAGPRISEAVRSPEGQFARQPADGDPRGPRQGSQEPALAKAGDRYVMLSPKLRDYWRIARPQEWLFPEAISAGRLPPTPLSTPAGRRAFAPASPSPSPRTRCAMPLQSTCSKQPLTCAPFSCSLANLRRDNQDEDGASIKMRMPPGS
jgi:integrase/recombinase XerD